MNKKIAKLLRITARLVDNLAYAIAGLAHDIDPPPQMTYDELLKRARELYGNQIVGAVRPTTKSEPGGLN